MSSLFTHRHDFWYYRISLHVFALHIHGIIQYAFFFLSLLTPICYFKNHPNSCIYLEFVNFYCSLCKIHSMQCLWLEMESYAFSDKEASWVQYFKSWNHLSWSHPYPYDLILVTLGGERTSTSFDCSLLADVLMDHLVRLTGCCSQDSPQHTGGMAYLCHLLQVLGVGKQQAPITFFCWGRDTKCP